MHLIMAVVTVAMVGGRVASIKSDIDIDSGLNSYPNYSRFG